MTPRIMCAVVVVALLAMAPSAGGHQASTKRCANVAFTPNSDDLAANIEATGLTCGLARDFIRDSAGRPGARFRGFRCTRSSQPNPQALPYTRYRCTGAGDVIRWRRY